MDEIAECGNCEFYKPSGKRMGKCQRLPPFQMQGTKLGEFPGVLLTWWCGEYKDVEAE